MSKTKEVPITDAVEILHRRYFKDDPKRLAALERARVNGDVAQAIYDLRTSAGLTQRDLAKLVGTQPSVICRLEDADYEGHSLGMLTRIAAALGKYVQIRVTDHKFSHPKTKVRVRGHRSRSAPSARISETVDRVVHLDVSHSTTVAGGPLTLLKPQAASQRKFLVIPGSQANYQISMPGIAHSVSLGGAWSPDAEPVFSRFTQVSESTTCLQVVPLS